MTQNDGDNGRLDFPNGFNSKPKRRARAREGLASIGDALAAAGVCESSEPMTARARALGDTDTMPIADALASVEQPQGALLLEAQGQRDLSLTDGCARKLARRMIASGKEVNEDTIKDAIGVGNLALAQWRVTGAGVDGQRETLAARVAWRAVVVEMSRDTFGDSMTPVHTVGDDWIYANALPCESRAERAARLRAQRAVRGYVLPQDAQIQMRKVDGNGNFIGFETLTIPKGTKVSSRFETLARRMASLPCNHGRRAQTIEKVSNALAMLLNGMTLDEAASATGYNGDKANHTAGDTFIKTCKRVGLIRKTGNGGQQFTARMSTRADADEVQTRRAFAKDTAGDYEKFAEQVKPMSPQRLQKVLGV